MTIKLTEAYAFNSLGDLRDWLNDFEHTDLETVYPQDGDTFSVRWYEETLSDGSKVENVTLHTV